MDLKHLTIKKFKGVEHRLEFVRKIGNVSFYNDSASTNPQTAAAAVMAFSIPHGTLNSKLILIAGGKDKNLNYKPLAQAIKKSCQVKAIILFGENKNKIRKEIRDKKLEIRTCNDLKSAVKTAYQIAKKLVNPDARSGPRPIASGLITVVLSPGSASFDMFKDYQDRGEQFKKIVRKLKK